MTGMTLTSTAGDHAGRARARLREHVGRSVTRGRLVASIGGLLWGAALFAAGLLVLVICDAGSPMSGAARLIGLLLVVVTAGALGGWCVVRPWLRRGRELAAAERVESAAGATDQPVVRGVTMRHAGDDDPLADALRERAEQRAADVAQRVEPARAYPTKAIGRQGRWLWLACVGWLVLAVVFPNQLLGVFSRALMPWVDTPPFSLTQLDPQWTPEQPEVGDDVAVVVEPEGVNPGQVDFVRLDAQGNEAERFEMTRDEQGGFSHVLRSVREPVTFKLEANGRASRAYTIDPVPQAPGDAGDDDPPPATNEPDPADSGGTTSYDADALAERTVLDQAGWDALQEQVGALLEDLANAQAIAGAIDPADAQAIADLADQLAGLSARSGALSEQLAATRSALPASVAAALASLQDALDQLSQSRLPTPPSSSTEAADNTGDPSDAAAQRWLDQAGQTAGQNRAQLAQGLGEAQSATDHGTTSGRAEGGAPVFNDPRARGGYDESAAVGDDGPLPDAVMQQVPLSYRAHVAAYFDALTQSQPDTGDSP